MRTSAKSLSRIPILAVILGWIYVASYFAILALPARYRLPRFTSSSASGTPIVIHSKFISVNGHWSSSPDYHGLPDALFAPIHYFDRTYLRPSRWEGYDPTGGTDFSWLMRALTK